MRVLSGCGWTALAIGCLGLKGWLNSLRYYSRLLQDVGLPLLSVRWRPRLIRCVSVRVGLCDYGRTVPF